MATKKTTTETAPVSDKILLVSRVNYPIFLTDVNGNRVKLAPRSRVHVLRKDFDLDELAKDRRIIIGEVSK